MNIWGTIHNVITFIIQFIYCKNSSWDQSLGATKLNRTSPIQFSCGPPSMGNSLDWLRSIVAPLEIKKLDLTGLENTKWHPDVIRVNQTVHGDIICLKQDDWAPTRRQGELSIYLGRDREDTSVCEWRHKCNHWKWGLASEVRCKSHKWRWLCQADTYQTKLRVGNYLHWVE